ncbi:MAG: hypothetical protein K2P98_04795 [Neisseriaceae bacterium]|nr:hypothetical protein [Neisseriaceae bacterium]
MKVGLKMACVGLLLGAATSSFAVLPPKYLGIQGVESCLCETTRGSATFVCLPKTKRPTCSAASWKKLQALKGKDAVPACPPSAKPKPKR